MSQHLIQGPEQSNKAEIDFGATLSGRQFQMKIVWVPRQKFWKFSMIGPEARVLIRGIRVISNLDMLQPYNMPELPPGKLVCHDTTNLQEPPGREDFIKRHQFVYVDPEPPPEPPDVRITEEVIGG